MSINHDKSTLDMRTCCGTLELAPICKLQRLSQGKSVLFLFFWPDNEKENPENYMIPYEQALGQQWEGKPRFQQEITSSKRWDKKKHTEEGPQINNI